MHNFVEELNQLYKADPELADVLDVVKQVSRFYSDIQEVRGLTNKSVSSVVKNSAEVQILFQPNSSAEIIL